MPRIRNIKPDFWTDEKLVELSPWARLLFIGLWNFADDEGYMPYSPRKIKMQVFPAESLEISVPLSELYRARVIDLYDSEIGQVLHITHWDRHQKVSNPTPSKIARLSLTPVTDGGGFTENSVPVHTEGEGEGEGERSSVLTFRTDASPSAIAKIGTLRVVDAWIASNGTQRPPQQIIDHASAQIASLVRQGIPEAQIMAGIREWWSGKYPPSTIPNYVARAGQAMGPKVATGTQRMKDAYELATALEAQGE